MSEPVMRRTLSGGVARSSRTPVSRIYSPLGKALSLCSVLSILAFTVAPLTVQAAEPASLYSIVSEQAQSSLLLDITVAGKRLVAVGDRGHILYSDDNGSTWTQSKVPTRQLLTSVYFVDDKHGWAVGHDAQILATTDAGQTWVKQFEDLSREAPLLDIWFKDDAKTGFAVGAYGALLATTDGGANWEDVSDRMNNEDGYHLNSITAVKDSGLFVVGELGVMFRSADWGQTWENVESPYDGSLFGAVATKEPATLLAYGLRGHLFRSSDFGDSWQQIEINTPNNGPLEFGLADGELLADGSIVVVGHGGTVLKSTDDGRSFSLVNRADRVSLSSAATTDNGKLILVGQGGVHVASPTGADLGQQ
ncbi:WD40/YVTN/BNR-like repeat-containing protein [Pseudomonas sp. RL_15y_Pfl2_60]|uniref:WD40/YVTN/BNR-like repeat-containing protein n=1 Tax=Pseudomonas sp. RL_15y_Pfl2_60 TaxID=3088709 RepID=UPI00403F64BE